MTENGTIQAPAPIQDPRQQITPVDARMQENITARRDLFSIAKQDPRDEDICLDRVLVACRRPSLAEVAIYDVKNRGTGPSVKLMEEIARHWRNFKAGTRIIDLGEIGTQSRVEVYAIDLESRYERTEEIIIEHVLVGKAGVLNRCKTPDDVYLAIGQRVGRRLREVIKDVIPSWVTDLAMQECVKTKNADKGSAAAKERLVGGFSLVGVTEEMLIKKFKKPVNDLHPDEVAELRNVYASINSGEMTAAEYFDTDTKIEAVDAPAKKPRKSAKEKTEEVAQESSATTAPSNSTTTSPIQGTVEVVDTSEVQTDAPVSTPSAQQAEQEIEQIEDGDPF